MLYLRPAGKGRARSTKAGRTYTPAKTRTEEAAIRYWLKQLKAPHFGGGPVYFNITAQFIKPKSAKRPYPTVKPDADNILKMIADACNGILYDDDKQIVSSRIVKVYGDEDKIEITIGAY